MIILERASLLDGTSPDRRPDHYVAIDGPEIVEISDKPIRIDAAERIDLAGRTLMPGLIDAHFHPTLTESIVSRWRQVPPTLMTARAARILGSTLMRGFTTVRDMGGGDWGLRQALTEKAILGPRMFIAGRAIAQTGGHGDMRSRTDGDALCGCQDSMGFLATIVDGVPAVQNAAREQLRQGADHLKIFAGGGLFTSNVPLGAVHFTASEIEAIVHEAHAWGSYVGAHAYTAEAIGHSIRAGVRTIEHGNFLDQKTAQLLADRQAFLVPTLATYYATHENRDRLNLSTDMQQKLSAILDAGVNSIDTALRAGVRVGFGTDLIGNMHEFQSEEFTLRARAQSAYDVICSATTVNADILRMTGRLGVIAPGALADLIVVEGNPANDLSLLQHQGRHLDLIVKNGEIVKRAL